jgi:hypothetical protein
MISYEKGFDDELVFDNILPSATRPIKFIKSIKLYKFPEFVITGKKNRNQAKPTCFFGRVNAVVGRRWQQC